MLLFKRKQKSPEYTNTDTDRLKIRGQEKISRQITKGSWYSFNHIKLNRLYYKNITNGNCNRRFNLAESYVSEIQKSNLSTVRESDFSISLLHTEDRKQLKLLKIKTILETKVIYLM